VPPSRRECPCAWFGGGGIAAGSAARRQWQNLVDRNGASA
jgi:hypothetical protein